MEIEDACPVWEPEEQPDQPDQAEPHRGAPYGNQNALGHKKSEECKRKMSEKAHGRIMTEETRARMSESARKMSDERRAKINKAISEGNKGKVIPQTQRDLISSALLGTTKSDETKAKMAEAKRGKMVYYNLTTGETGSCDVALYRNKDNYVACCSKACKEDREDRKRRKQMNPQSAKEQ